MRFDRFIKGTRSVMNTDFQPISVFYATLYENKDLPPLLASFLRILERAASKHLITSILLFLSFTFLIVSRRREITGMRLSAFVYLERVFFRMIIELMLIFCFQAMYGYVFSWIGMLLACFMGGLGSGSILVAQARRRWGHRFFLFLFFEALILLFPFFFALIVTSL